MHKSALDKMQAFVDGYLTEAGNQPLSILEVGSMVAHDGQSSHRKMMTRPNWNYVGMDIAEGPNVDVAVKDPYHWTEFSDHSFDVVISSQVFEHVQYFWVSAMEIARVLRPGGLCCIIAPSAGHVHRHPFDCWRFYPDGLPSVFAYTGLTPLESYIHTKHLYYRGGDKWRDACLVATKPRQNTATAASQSLKYQLTQLLLKPNLTQDEIKQVAPVQQSGPESPFHIDTGRDIFLRLESDQLKNGRSILRKGQAMMGQLRSALRTLRD